MTGKIVIDLVEHGKTESEDGVAIEQGINMSVDVKDITRKGKAVLLARFAQVIRLDDPLEGAFYLMEGFRMIKASEGGEQ